MINFLNNETTLLIVLIVLAILILYVAHLSFQVRRLKTNHRKFMRGKDAKSLEEVILAKFDEFDKYASLNKRNYQDILSIQKEIEKHYKAIGIVRYNAFVEMGGNLSFALTMLNENKDGWIMNVLHSRDGCYTYMKEVLGGNCFIALSDEEKESLGRAIFQENYDLEADVWLASLESS